jgi:hypothetical protein
MPRIKIEDLPVLEEIQQEELKGIFGGGGLVPTVTDDASASQTTLTTTAPGDRVNVGL